VRITVGLYYNGARYLAAWLGRWMSADPIGIGADGPGLYNYTRGSPVNYTDPSGTQGAPPAKFQEPREAPLPPAYERGQAESSPEAIARSAAERDPVGAAAKAHGALQAELYTTQQEIKELYDAWDRGGRTGVGSPARFWNLEGYLPVEGVRERGERLKVYEKAGLATVDATGHWRSTIRDQAVKAGLLEGADAQRFDQVAGHARHGGVDKWLFWRVAEVLSVALPTKGAGGGGLLARNPISSAGVLVALGEAKSAVARAAEQAAGTAAKEIAKTAERVPPIRNLYGGAKADVTVGEQLKGTGQIAALERNPNLKGVSVRDLLSRTPEELKKQLTAKQFSTLMKHFQGRDLRRGK